MAIEWFIGIVGVVFLAMNRWQFIAGNAKLLQFYFRNLLNPLTLPRELYDESAMRKRLDAGKAFEIVVEGGKDYVENYENGMQQLASQISAKGSSLGYGSKQIIFWLIRFACIVCAFRGSFKLTVLMSLLQFVALPYSFFVAIGYGLETVFVLYTGHLVVFPALNFLVEYCVSAEFNVMLTIQPGFLLGFILIDQMVCLMCLFRTPKGTTAPMSAARILHSVWYGFLNCKTYYLVLLPLSFGFEVQVVPWVVDAAFGLSAKISTRIGHFWEVLFYHAHRMGHIRHVYADAHKFHHHLHDCTAFDAHIFGSGAPEEWLLLMSDLVLLRGLGCIPASLGYHALSVSWLNKWRFHSRSDDPDAHSDNFHADHHSVHRANFGFAYPYEMFMKTTTAQFAEKSKLGGFVIERFEEGSTVKLRFTPTEKENAIGKK